MKTSGLPMLVNWYSSARFFFSAYRYIKNINCPAKIMYVGNFCSLGKRFLLGCGF